MTSSPLFFDELEALLQEHSLGAIASDLINLSNQEMIQRPHGDEDKWREILTALPVYHDLNLSLDSDVVTAIPAFETADIQHKKIEESLKGLHPWRKGPFNLMGVEIDSEWRSNLKWARLADKISPLVGRRVLDVGCGNGYYLYRMLGEGAKMALGIDPTRLFLYQFLALQTFFRQPAAQLLPLKSEHLSQLAFSQSCGFDTVFSMGILYHRRKPLEHLSELKNCLLRGGELILETLVIPGEDDTQLVPENRYAQMRNVWSVPTLKRLTRQLEIAGFSEIEVLDVTTTTFEEQRSTRWMTFDSLRNFLDPQDLSRTIEGYPAPTRAILKSTAI